MNSDQRDMRIAEWARKQEVEMTRLLEGAYGANKCECCDAFSAIDLCPSCWARIAEVMKGSTDAH